MEDVGEAVLIFLCDVTMLFEGEVKSIVYSVEVKDVGEDVFISVEGRLGCVEFRERK